MMKALALSFGDYVMFEPLTSGKLIKKSDVIDNVFFSAFFTQDDSSISLEDKSSNAGEEYLRSIKEETLRLIALCHSSG
jgi:hypothetical protein